MYTQESLDAVRNVEIFDVVSKFIELKREGANYKAKSPFKDEKTSSFVVSPAKNIFKCFATGIGGDAIKFVQLYKKISFPEAVKIIAELSNITLQEEEQSEEQKRYKKTAQSLKMFNDDVALKYTKILQELQKTHWCKQMLSDRGYNNDSIIKFQLGYAPGNLVSKAVIKNGKLEFATATGLVITKYGTSYDFLKDRLIFPIRDMYGQTIAFGGRRSDAEAVKKYPKYLNTSDSPIYNKSKVLYGLYEARQNIGDKGYAVLVEGYTDVISLHQSGCNTAVATCGTALTKEHALKLRQICNHIILFRDGDKAGLNALLKEGGDIDTLISVGVKVSVCIAIDGEDPDSMCRLNDIDITHYIQKNSIDAVIFKASYFKNEADDTPMGKAIALNRILKTLTNITNELVRSEYAKEIAKLYAVSVRMVQTELKKMMAVIAEKEALKNQEKSKSYLELEDLGLPEGANPEQYIRDRFAIVGNSYHFYGKDGFFKGTNHKMTALFHVYGRSENKRLCEVVNDLGQKRLIDFDSKDFINFNKIQERLIEEGIFMWLPNSQNIHFKLVTQKLLRDFIMAYELKTLGWQKEGFFAFADGVFFHGKFQPVNKYGIIQIETDEHKETEYLEEVKHFYSPAFSEVYKSSRDDDDPYENDRNFVFKQAPVSFSEWMRQMVKVYDEKGHVAIAFAIATLFRDFIMKRHSLFPHLFLTGEKGSGKSKFGDSIANLFTYKLAPFDLNSGTIVGFYRRLSRIKNAPVFFEEFHDKIDDRMFQSLKGAYDGRGREKGNMTADNRTSVSKINSSCILAGQYLSSRDDNSLTSRSLILHFIKPQESYPKEKIDNYDLLKKWEDIGLSSLVLEVLKYRELFEQNFHLEYSKNINKFKKSLKDFDYQERMLQNYNVLYTPVSLLYSRFDFPFKLEDFYEQCKNSILENSDLIVESEGMAEFWRALEHLFKRNIIREGIDFIIDTPIDVVVNPKKNEKYTYKNTDRHQILFLRLNSVHSEYHLYASKLDGVDIIGESTIRNYFKSKKYFISPKKAHRFKDSSSSCYLFNYDMMRNTGVLNLDRQIPTNDTPNSNESSKDPNGIFE